MIFGKERAKELTDAQKETKVRNMCSYFLVLCESKNSDCLHFSVCQTCPIYIAAVKEK